jgi:uncharacterized membrane protein YsdA (DUF1294 family)
MGQFVTTGVPSAVLAALGWFVAINLGTFALYWWDKRQSRLRQWRVPEAHLLGLATVGGWPAAKLAQRRLRHKTRKQPFARLLNVISGVWIAALVTASLAMLAGFP